MVAAASLSLSPPGFPSPRFFSTPLPHVCAARRFYQATLEAWEQRSAAHTFDYFFGHKILPDLAETGRSAGIFVIFGLGGLMRNQRLQSGFSVCVFVQPCGATHVSCGCVEHRRGSLEPIASAIASAVLGRWRSRLLRLGLFWESYSYRIGTNHKCRDAAFADAGVPPGALVRSIPLLTSLGWH